MKHYKQYGNIMLKFYTYIVSEVNEIKNEC